MQSQAEVGNVRRSTSGKGLAQVARNPYDEAMTAVAAQFLL